MKLHQKLMRTSHGDTIIEVVLALSVLGLIIGTSTVLANRNTRSLQATQENSVATRLAQEQLEYVKTLAGQDPEALIDGGSGKFCVRQLPADPENPSATRDLEIVNGADMCKLLNGAADYETTIRVTPTDEDDVYTATIISEITNSLLEGDQKVQLSYKVRKKMTADIVRRVGALCPSGQVRTAAGVCVPKSPAIKVTVNKIPPPASNNTPPCTSAATASRAGTRAELTDNGKKFTQSTAGSPSSTIFSGLTPLVTDYPLKLTAPTGHEFCPGGQTVINTNVTGPINDGITKEVIYTIRPKCTSTNTYGWVQGAYLGNYNYGAMSNGVYTDTIYGLGTIYAVYTGVSPWPGAYTFYVYSASWGVTATTWSCPS